jgi:hypothetical protein
MAEVLMEFEDTVRDTRGIEYIARACGRECDDGHWEGWIEFTPLGGGEAVRSGRETTQPNRTDTEYWATGLTPVFLEGALRRAMEPRQKAEREDKVQSPTFHEPAPDLGSRPGASARRPVRARPVLDPFHVYEQGEDILRAELGALDGPRLRDIVRAYALASGDSTNLMRASQAELTDIIVTAVRREVAQPSRTASRAATDANGEAPRAT